MDKRLRLLACGCLHGDQAFIHSLAEKAVKESVDLVVLCGDFIHDSSERVSIFKPFLEHGKRVVFVSGNHDGFSLAHFFALYYGITHLHGKSAVYNDIGFFGCSGANVGSECLTEDQIFSYLDKGHGSLGSVSKKILVTHVPPSGTLWDKLSPFVSGSTGVRKAVNLFSPDVVLCSHIHEGSGMEMKIGNTRVVNVARKGIVLEL